MTANHGQGFSVQCPNCGLMLVAYPALGTSINRAKDVELITHNKVCGNTSIFGASVGS